MIGGSEVNPDQWKQQAQYMNMRGAQQAQEKAGQQTAIQAAPKAEGTKKQLIGTVGGVLAVIAVLVLLSVLRGM